MMPPLASGRIVSALAPDTRLDLIAASDIGAFAAAAFADPARFAGADLPLAAESLTMGEVAALIGDVTGRPVAAIHVDQASGACRLVSPTASHGLGSKAIRSRSPRSIAGASGSPASQPGSRRTAP